MKMNFLRSMISDARPRKSMSKVFHGSSTGNEQHNSTIDGVGFSNGSEMDSSEGKSKVTSSLSHSSEHHQLDHATNFPSYAIQKNGVNDSFAKSESIIDRPADSAPSTIKNSEPGSTLSEDLSVPESKNQYDQTSTASLNDMTWQKNGRVTETALTIQDKANIFEQHEPNIDTILIPDTTQNVAVTQTDHSLNPLPQFETKDDFEPEQEKHPATNLNEPTAAAIVTASLTHNEITPDTRDSVELITNDSFNKNSSLPEKMPTNNSENQNPIQNSIQSPTDRSRGLPISKTIISKQTDSAQVLPDLMSQSKEKLSVDNSSDVILKKNNNSDSNRIAPSAQAVPDLMSQSKEKLSVDNSSNVILKKNNNSDSNRIAPIIESKVKTKPEQEKSTTKVTAPAQPASVPVELLHNNLVSRNSDRQVTKNVSGNSIITAKTPEVRIGQVDVFIEAPHKAKAGKVATSRPSPSLSSRHYLRRL